MIHMDFGAGSHLLAILFFPFWYIFLVLVIDVPDTQGVQHQIERPLMAKVWAFLGLPCGPCVMFDPTYSPSCIPSHPTINILDMGMQGENLCCIRSRLIFICTVKDPFTHFSLFWTIENLSRSQRHLERLTCQWV